MWQMDTGTDVPRFTQASRSTIPRILFTLVLPFIITVTYSGVEAPAPQGARRENTGSI
jgi:hypothetical protein